MENELSIKEKEIFEILKKLAEQSTFYKLETKERETFGKMVTELLSTVSAFSTKSPKNVALLLQIYNIIAETNQRLRFSQLFDSPLIDVVIPYNTAVFHQKGDDPQKALVNLMLAIIALESLAEAQGARCIALQLLLGEFYLQATALYSQTEDHARALKLAEQGLKQAVSTARLVAAKQTAQTPLHAIAARLVAHIDALLDAARRFGEQRSHPRGEKFLSWTHNPENKHRYFNSPSQENVRLSASWLEHYAVADMMFLSLLDFESCSRAVGSETELIRVVNTIGAACFSVATEKRILGGIEVQRAIHENDSKQENCRLKELRKVYNLRENGLYRESEFYYTQSIEVLRAFLEKSLIMNALVIGYATHYAPTNYITEEEEASCNASQIDRRGILNLSELSAIIPPVGDGAVRSPLAQRVLPRGEETGSDFAVKLVEGDAPKKQKLSSCFQKLITQYGKTIDSEQGRNASLSLTSRAIAGRENERKYLASPTLQKTMVKTSTAKTYKSPDCCRGDTKPTVAYKNSALAAAVKRSDGVRIQKCRANNQIEQQKKVRANVSPLPFSTCNTVTRLSEGLWQTEMFRTKQSFAPSAAPAKRIPAPKTDSRAHARSNSIQPLLSRPRPKPFGYKS